MVDRNIVNKLGLSNEQIEEEINSFFTTEHKQLLEEELQKTVEALVPGTIVKGRIVTQLGNDVIVELGLKSEGIVDASEFDGCWKNFVRHGRKSQCCWRKWMPKAGSS